MKTRLTILAATALGLLAPAAAQAHISIHPNTIPAKAFATVHIRVPGEQPGAHVTRVDMLLPPGLSGVEYGTVPGWSVKLVETGSQVSQVIWTWNGPLNRIDNGQFILFPLSLAMPDTPGSALLFKTVQAYSNGKLVHWIEQGLEAEFPAPRVNVTPPGGVLQDIAGKEAGPQAGATGATSASSGAVTATRASSSPRASRTLAIVALIVGALGLALGAGGLLAAGRARAQRRGGAL